MSGCAWVTLATNDTYCLGALVLAHSLKRVSTNHQLAIIITPQVSSSMREQLSKVFNVIHLVDVLDSQDATNLALLQRPDLGVTFTKIHCWTLTQFSKCVFLDADTLVMQNCDELMEREELSAAPDPGWPDCFNSGVFVFVPSLDTFNQLIQFASTHGSFDGGDQGLLNMYFNDWPTNDIRRHLSFLYNMCSTSTYTYLPALNYYGANIKIVHFIGPNKPWLLGPSSVGMSSFSQAWWDTFQSHVVQLLTKDMTGLAGALGSKEKSAIEEQWRKQNWEQGNIDFTGKDSFENIWMKIMEAVNKPRADTVKASPQKVDVPVAPAPKEIASQAIPEKEKADIPEEQVKPDEGPAGNVVKSVIPFTPPPIPCEIPKKEEILMAPTPSQPIPMPPPTPEAITSLTEPVKPPVEGIQASPLVMPVSGVVEAVSAVPLPVTSSQPIPTENVSLDQIALSQTPSAQDPTADRRLELERAIEVDDMKKVEEILSEISGELALKLAEDYIERPLKLSNEIKKTEEALPSLPPLALANEPNVQAVESKTVEAPLPEPPKADATKEQALPNGLPQDKSPKPETPSSETVKPDVPKVEAIPPAIPISSQAQSEPKPEEVKVQPSIPTGPQQSKSCDQPPNQTKLTETTPDQHKPTESQVEQPKPSEPQKEQFKSSEVQLKPTESQPDQTKPTESKPDEPKPTESKPDQPKPIDSKPDQPTPTEIKPDQPTPVEIKPDQPKPIESKPDQPTPNETKPDQPKPIESKPDQPKPIESKPDKPTPNETKPDQPKPIESKPAQPIPNEAKPDQAKPTETKLDQPNLTETKSDQPKPLDAQPEVPKTEAPVPAAEMKDAVFPPLNISSQIQGKTEVQKVAPVETEVPACETKETAPTGQSQKHDSAAKPQSNAGGKQKTPPKDQSKEGHKSGKQQAPQPPPKNGKQKKGQHPEPTTAHPLAETPVQEQQKPEPLTPLEPAEKSVPEPQPGTPTVIAPTPPVTPVDAPKTVDPLSAQIEEPLVGATSSGPAEAPVPPKRKGKGNDSGQKQPQKQQNNGGKGKGKK